MAVANEAGSEERPVGTGATGSCGGCGCGGDREDGPAELIPDWLARADAAAAHRLDVRPMLAAGEGPFAAVMHAAGGAAEGALLLIEAPFDPQPLRRVLAGKGFSTYGERVALGHWQIWCRRGDARADREGEVAADGRALTWRSGGAVHIDVRGLEAPKPLIAILGLIDGGGHAGHIVVHHDRDPLYLYPELEERRWRYTHVPGAEGEVRLELRGPG